MKKILGIVSSPRKPGNSEMIVKEIIRHIPVFHEAKLLNLHDFDIRPCTGCYRCLFKDRRCILDDDLEIVLSALLDSDGVIVAAPTYFLGPNSMLKRFLDRGLSFYAHKERLWRKPAVGACVAGIEGREGYTLLGIENFFKMVLFDVKKIGMFYGALPGEVFFDEDNKKQCRQLGEALFAEGCQHFQNKASACPLCGGTVFRFYDDNKIQCMLCSNRGHYRIEKNALIFDVKRGEHELFLTESDAREHEAWLQMMKNHFSSEKKRLKEISQTYRQGWEWITP